MTTSSRIEKLLRLAADSSTTREEAMRAAERANVLLREGGFLLKIPRGTSVVMVKVVAPDERRYGFADHDLLFTGKDLALAETVRHGVLTFLAGDYYIVALAEKVHIR